MEDKIRETRITLGNKTYLLRTALSAEKFEDIMAFSQKLFSSLDPKADQEKRFLLGWMYMAYKLQQVQRKLAAMIDKYGDAESQRSVEDKDKQGGQVQ
ncbi:MAG: flagellar biosynthesis protein FlaG [Pyramidobacter sp.]|jgi:hypothetical protein